MALSIRTGDKNSRINSADRRISYAQLSTYLVMGFFFFFFFFFCVLFFFLLPFEIIREEHVKNIFKHDKAVFHYTFLPFVMSNR